MGERTGANVPEGCDCCGHDAEDCGMFEAGWVTHRQLLAGGGTFCLPCAHLLRIVRLAEQCTWCEEPMVDESTAESMGWAYYADDLGELHPCCPGCLEGQFGIAGRFRLRGAL